MSKFKHRRRKKIGLSRSGYDPNQLEAIREAFRGRYETYVRPGKTIREPHVMRYPQVVDIDEQIEALKDSINNPSSNKPNCYYRLGAIYWRNKHDKDNAISYLGKAAKYDHPEAKELLNEIMHPGTVWPAPQTQGQKSGEKKTKDTPKHYWLDINGKKLDLSKLPKIDYARVELAGYDERGPIFIVTVQKPGTKEFVPAAAFAADRYNYHLKGQLFGSRKDAEYHAKCIKETWGR